MLMNCYSDPVDGYATVPALNFEVSFAIAGLPQLSLGKADLFISQPF